MEPSGYRRLRGSPVALAVAYHKVEFVRVLVLLVVVPVLYLLEACVAEPILDVVDHGLELGSATSALQLHLLGHRCLGSVDRWIDLRVLCSRKGELCPLGQLCGSIDISFQVRASNEPSSGACDLSRG